MEIILFNKSLKYERHNHLWQYVINDVNILTAIKIISRNKGKDTPGPDGLSYKNILNNDIEIVIKEIKARLLGKKQCYARQVEIPKANGKMRKLGITNIYDRIAQQCVRNVLEPIVEAHFNPESFGFRRDRNALQCVAYIATSLQFVNEGKIYDCDLSNYFDTVGIDKVIDKLKINHKIFDLEFLKCIKRLMWIDIINPFNETYNGIGLRQGTILGPILANVMFHDFEIKLNNINGFTRKNGRDFIKSTVFINYGRAYKKGKEFYFNWIKNRRAVRIIRYADDFILIGRGYDDIYDIIMMFEDWCKENGLSVNNDKTKLINITKDFKLTFLGYNIKKKSTKENSFLLSPKDQKKVWLTTKKKFRTSYYKKDISIFISYISGIMEYYSLTTNITWLISRIQKYLFTLVVSRGNRKDYRKRIKYVKSNDRVAFKIDNTLLDLWTMREKSIVSTKDIMLEINKFWDPNNFDDFSMVSWMNNFISNRNKVGRNSSNIIYVPSLIRQFKKDPLTNQPYLNEMPNNIEIHHIKPLSKGGTNEYTNLLLVRKEAHKLIHYPNLSIKEIPDYIIINKLNKYRKLCGLEPVKLKFD